MCTGAMENGPRELYDFESFVLRHSINPYYCYLLDIFRFRANMYPCPQNPSERKEMATGVLKRVEDLNRVRTRVFQLDDIEMIS